MVEYLEIGVCKYEIGIFLEGRVLEVFRTDLAEYKPIILSEAERRRDSLKKEYPDRNYRIKSIPKSMKVRNAIIFH